jgi:hypothetical protein
MCAFCLLAVKLGFQWHKATGEPIEPTPLAKPPCEAQASAQQVPGTERSVP